MSKKNIHPLILLSMCFVFFIAVIFKLAVVKLSLLYLILLPYCFQKDESRNSITGKRLWYIFFATLLLIINRFIFTDESSLDLAKYFIRMMFLFSVSMFSFVAIEFDSILIYLMATKKLKTYWGYSLLLAINSLSLIKSEHERIAFNARLRGLKWHQQYLSFFSVLVFAIRHSERGGIALSTRGLNTNKLFYNVSLITSRDRVILISYFLLTLTFFLVG